MGTAFLYGNGGSGGTGATLTVTAPALCTVSIRKDGKTKTKTAGADGLAVFKGLETGTWTVTITDGEQTAQKTVTITADYSAAITFFSATINVTYPAGSTCTATDGVTTLAAPDTSGTWACVVPNAGTWTVALDSGFSEVVSVTENGGTYTVDKWYLYKSGVEYTELSGGWSIGVHTLNDGLGTVTKNSTNVYFNTTDTHHDDCPISTNNKVDLSKFSTIFAEFSSINGNGTNSPTLYIAYGSVRGLSGDNGVRTGVAYSGSTHRCISLDKSNVAVPCYVSAGIVSNDVYPVTSAYLTSVWVQ